MLYVDLPSLADLKSLAAHRDDICVSIYLPTTPVSREAAGDRIELKNLAKEALRQLETANADKRRVAALMSISMTWSMTTSSGGSRPAVSQCWRLRTTRGRSACQMRWCQFLKYRTDFTLSRCYAPSHFPIPALCWHWRKTRSVSFRSPPTCRPRW